MENDERRMEANKIVRFAPLEEEEEDWMKSGQWKSAGSLLKLGITDVPKLWDPIFPKIGIGGLTGPSDCGKSTFLRQLAGAVVSGEKEFLGYPLNLKHMVAYYITTEDGIESIAAAVSKQFNGLDEKSANRLLFLPSADDVILKLRKQLAMQPADIVFIDTWGDLFRGNPNSFSEVRRELQAFSELANSYKCFFMFIHHSGKNVEKGEPDKNKLNGSQALEAKLRVLLELRRGSTPPDRVLSILKGNYISDDVKQSKLMLNFDKENFQFTKTGNFYKTNLISKYDKEFWNSKMMALRNDKGLSYSEARELLVKEYPEMDVPGETWFKTNGKTVGPIITQGDGRPTDEQMNNAA